MGGPILTTAVSRAQQATRAWAAVIVLGLCGAAAASRPCRVPDGQQFALPEPILADPAPICSKRLTQPGRHPQPTFALLHLHVISGVPHSDSALLGFAFALLWILQLPQVLHQTQPIWSGEIPNGPFLGPFQMVVADAPRRPHPGERGRRTHCAVKQVAHRRVRTGRRETDHATCEYTALFNQIDQDDDGRISETEFMDTLHGDKDASALLGLPLPVQQEHEARRLFQHSDVVTLQEWLNFYVPSAGTEAQVPVAATACSETGAGATRAPVVARTLASTQAMIMRV